MPVSLDMITIGRQHRKVIVTGGAGFIGSAFVAKLNREGVDDIWIVDHLGHGSAKWQNLVGLRFTDYLHKDEFLRRLLSNALDFRPDAVVHMGACSSTTEQDADYLMENNYRYTRTLAEWSLEQGARFIYASSAATYGDGETGFSDDTDPMLLKPCNAYGYSKHLFDLHALRSGLLQHMAGLKFFNVFGPGEAHKADMASMVFKAFHQISQTGRVRLFKSHRPDYTDGGQRRDFVYVMDCVAVMWWLLNHGQANGLFNLGSGRARTWNDLARSVFTALNRPVHIDFIEMPATLRKHYQYYTEADMKRLAQTGCPLEFRPLEVAVRDYVSMLFQNQEMPHSEPGRARSEIYF